MIAAIKRLWTWPARMRERRIQFLYEVDREWHRFKTLVRVFHPGPDNETPGEALVRLYRLYGLKRIDDVEEWYITVKRCSDAIEQKHGRA